jgi:hypothetical protein
MIVPCQLEKHCNLGVGKAQPNKALRNVLAEDLIEYHPASEQPDAISPF